MPTWRRVTDIQKSELEIDLDTIPFMRRNGDGTDITLNTGQTLTVRERPEELRNSKAARNFSSIIAI